MTGTPRTDRPSTPPPVAGTADRASSGDALHASVPADTEDDPVPHLSREPDCWLCVAVVGGAGPAWSEPVLDRVAGPVFAGVPVLASDGTSLVAVGGDAEGRLRVWRGAVQAMEVVGELDPELTPVAIVRHDHRWHLVVTDGEGRSRHLETADLARWRENPDLVDDVPNLVVRGVAATSDGLVLLGEVVVRGHRAGWTLLDSSAGSFRPRELRFPVAAEHRVLGPVAVADDGLALVIATGGSTLLARTSPGAGTTGWVVSLLTPDVAPSVVMGDGGRLWVAGRDPMGSSPMVADAGGRGYHLDRRGGDVVAAVAHRGELVMARRPIDVGRDPPAWLHARNHEPVGEPTDPPGQSSPAYIDSISLA